MFSAVSSGGIAVMATNILSNAVFHIIEGNVFNHKIWVYDILKRYIKECVFVLVYGQHMKQLFSACAGCKRATRSVLQVKTVHFLYI